MCFKDINFLFFGIALEEDRKVVRGRAGQGMASGARGVRVKRVSEKTLPRFMGGCFSEKFLLVKKSVPQKLILLAVCLS